MELGCINCLFVVPRLDGDLLLLGGGILLNYPHSLNHLLIKLLLLIFNQGWLGNSSGCGGMSCGSRISVGASLVGFCALLDLDEYYVFVVVIDFNLSRSWIMLKVGMEDGLFGLMPMSNEGDFDERT